MKHAAIVGIMLPALFMGQAWAAEVSSVHLPHPGTHNSLPPSASSPTTSEKKVVTEVQDVPFEEQRVNDSTLAIGQEVVRQEGRSGVKTVTFEITYGSDGQELGRIQINEELHTPPTTKIIAVGVRSGAAVKVNLPARATASAQTNPATSGAPSQPASPTPTPSAAPSSNNRSLYCAAAHAVGVDPPQCK